MKYLVEFIPRRDLDGDHLRPARWSSNGTVFTGTEVEAAREAVELSDCYGSDLVFRLTPIVDIQPPEHTCGDCGGDTRDPVGTQFACRCMPGVRWARDVAAAVAELAAEES